MRPANQSIWFVIRALLPLPSFVREPSPPHRWNLNWHPNDEGKLRERNMGYDGMWYNPKKLSDLRPREEWNTIRFLVGMLPSVCDAFSFGSLNLCNSSSKINEILFCFSKKEIRFLAEESNQRLDEKKREKKINKMKQLLYSKRRMK